MTTRPRIWWLSALMLLVTAAPAGAALKTRTFDLPAGGKPRSITVGPDKALWFTSDFTGNAIGRITTGGSVTLFPLPAADSQPNTIVTGPDGNLWFTERNGGRIGRITSGGALTEFALPVATSKPRGIAVGPDGALWFTEFAAGVIGRITTAGAISEFAVGGQPLNIARNGASMWFTDPGIERIGEITTAGVATSHPVRAASGPEGITLGPDGNIWFTEEEADRVGTVSAGGAVTEFQSGITPGADAFGIVPGRDGGLFFTEFLKARLGRITPSGSVREYQLPAGVQQPMGLVVGPDKALWLAMFGSNQIVRAVPPLAPAVKATTPFAYNFVGGSAVFSQLAIKRIPKGGKAVIKCRGGGCKKRKLTVRKRSASLRKPFGRLRPGARLEVRVSAPGFSAFVRKFAITTSTVKVTTRCQPPGGKLRKRCG